MTVLIKLGGSLVTDKRRARSFRREIVQEIAQQIVELRAARPETRIVIGHGSGSFGHFEAEKHNTAEGVYSTADRLGFAKVGAVATELSHLILGELLAAGLPAVRFQPSSMLVTRDRQLQTIIVEPLLLALEQQLIPLVHGDIALDSVIGGAIMSTEALFAGLVKPLRARQIILLGDVDGVFDESGAPIARITPESFPRIAPLLGGSGGVDVTGGMLQKVTEMIGLAHTHPGLEIVIANGKVSGILLDLLLDGAARGTRICAQ
ncbi:MAG: hypothetical protein J4G18_02165 [Anaerolineae bacterium]|nr:hypothetical protein [Anaerolineae bacterium]